MRLWEVFTGRCVWHAAELAAGAAALAWNPNPEHHVLAVAGGGGVVLVETGTARGGDVDLTRALLAKPAEEEEEAAEKERDADEDEADAAAPKQRKAATTVAAWTAKTVGGRRVVRAALAAPARSVAWHGRGDYLVTVSPDAIASMQCVVHRASKRDSQAPLKRGDKGGAVQCATFHPNKPFLFVATRTAVRVYHLAKQELVKTLRSGVKWISCIDVHPSGDHVLVGSRDRRTVWFDMDLGERAYKTLKYHDKALRAVRYHKRYPLMATCGDDGRAHVFHAKVYEDLMTNPLLVPVKTLNAHSPKSGVGALDIKFHPTQPWLFSCGADGNVHLFHAL